MHEDGGNGDHSSGGAVASEAELVVGLAQVGLAADAPGAMTACHDSLDHDAGSGQCRVAGDDAGPLVAKHDRVADERGVNLTANDLQIGAAQPDQIRPDHCFSRRRDGCRAGGQAHVTRLHDNQRVVSVARVVAIAHPAGAADAVGGAHAVSDPAGSLSGYRGPPRISLTRSAVRLTAWPSSLIRQAGRSPLIPVTLTAPATAPSWPKYAAPRQKMPSASSSSSMAKPLLRTRARFSSSDARSVMVWPVRFRRPVWVHTSRTCS